MARIAEIRRGNIRLVWEHPSATGEWEQSSTEGDMAGFGVGVFPAMNDEGRDILLEECGLTAFADELPLNRLRYMSPQALEEFKLEHSAA